MRSSSTSPASASWAPPVTSSSRSSARPTLACALADRACRRGFAAVYCRLPRLVFELALARADGTYLKVLAGLAKVELLILDDWGLVTLDAQASADVMDVVDDRAGLRSTIVTSQLPVSEWHDSCTAP